MPILSDVVPSLDQVMGVKAVWGHSVESVMCFGARGDAGLKDKKYFSQARITAEKALAKPFFITVGGGDEVPSELRNRVLELVRATSVYGETKAFVQNKVYLQRLQQWPVAIVVSEVYRFVGSPHLYDDLHFEGDHILLHAYDTILNNPEKMEQLWGLLADHEIEKTHVGPPIGFLDPGKVMLCSSAYPMIRSTSIEGAERWKKSKSIESDPALKRAAKERNRDANGGALRCEACGFEDLLNGMFDAHHLTPLAAGIRETSIDDLAVVCPTCHRWAHSKCDDKLVPVPIPEIMATRKR